MNTQTHDTQPLFAWLYPDGHHYRLTIGPHIDDPVDIISNVWTYKQARDLAREYDARPRNF
jgi:hypothetical protein